MKRRTPEVCPVCGEDVPRNAAACPECGACHESGWQEDAQVYDGVDLLDEGTEDRDGTVRWDREPGIRPVWRIVALVLVVALLWGFWRIVFPPAG